MKSKKILAVAIVSALIISATGSAISVSAAGADDVQNAVDNSSAAGFTVDDSEESTNDDGAAITTGSISKTVTLTFVWTAYDDETSENASLVDVPFTADYVYNDDNQQIEFGSIVYSLSGDPDVDKESDDDYEYTWEWDYSPLESIEDFSDVKDLTISGEWTKTSKTQDPPQDSPQDSEVNSYDVDVWTNDGYSWVSQDSIAITPDDDGNYKITAPAALSNSLNKFDEWFYSFETADDYSYGYAQAGETLNFNVSDGAPVWIEFFAVWQDSDGKISTKSSEFGVFIFYASANKGDKDPKGYDAYELDEGKGNYVVRLAVKGAYADGTYDLAKGEFTPAAAIIPDVDVPAKEGYTFVGWSTSLGGAVKYKPGDSVPVTLNEDGDIIFVGSDEAYGSLELFAVYEQKSNPGTGDDFNAVPFIAAAVVALGAASGVMIYRKKRETSEDAE